MNLLDWLEQPKVVPTKKTFTQKLHTMLPTPLNLSFFSSFLGTPLRLSHTLRSTRRGERREMAKRKCSSAPSSSRARKKVDRDAKEAESIQWLDKLPGELWEKVVDNLENDDLFPLALSCRYFREKQKELVARKRQKKKGSKRVKPRHVLQTNLKRKLDEGQPASADYLWFCWKEKVSRVVRRDGRSSVVRRDGRKAHYTRCLAALHGHLPLLQELQRYRYKGIDYHKYEITRAARSKSSTVSSSSSLFRLLTSLFLSFSSSQCAEANWRPCSG